MGATVVALVWANVAGGSYDGLWGAHAALGPGWLHLDLALSEWVADGLLAVFFFVAGMEVRRELTVGELAGARAAALPLFAALGGIVLPALVAIAVSGGEAASGGAWAVPVATDIAFALGVLALAGSGLPDGVRALLLSMAVIDDLVAIALIAVLFTDGLALGWLAAALVPLTAFAWSVRRDGIPPAVLWVLGVAAWVCVHASGVHATVAGIALGLLVPVRPRPGEARSAGERFEHRLHPVSAGIVVPLFALAAAGIPVAAAGDALGRAAAVGVIAGLLIGKPVGILAGARLAVRARLGELPPGVRWGDAAAVAVLGGIGYTVSLLVAHLATSDESAQRELSAAVLMASIAAAIAGIALLRARSSDRRAA